jgi:hypothetical protein
MDARYFVGDVPGLDGGLEVTYVLPRDWFPGRVMLRGMLRYYRENIALERPKDTTTQIIALPSQRTVIPAQESFLGLAGIEWRL